MITTVTKDNFAQEVLDADKPVLVDFWAAWCTPCRMLSPVVDEVAAEREDIKVCKINIDEEGELAIRHGSYQRTRSSPCYNGGILCGCL